LLLLGLSLSVLASLFMFINKLGGVDASVGSSSSAIEF
jgi:hypothetical protein